MSRYESSYQFLDIAEARAREGYEVGRSDSGHHLLCTVDGGGFSGIQSAAALAEFERAGVTGVVDEYRANSAGANNILSVATYQASLTPGVYMEIAGDRIFDAERFIAGEGPLFDIDVLLRRLMFGNPNLDTQAAIDNPARFGIDLTRFNDLTLFTKTNQDPDVTAENLAWWAVQSSKVPGLSGKPAQLPDGSYIGDGGLACVPPEYSAIRDALKIQQETGKKVHILSLHNGPEPTRYGINRMQFELLSRFMQPYGDPDVDIMSKFKELLQRQLQFRRNLQLGRFAADLGVNYEALYITPMEGEKAPGFATTNPRTLAVGSYLGQSAARRALGREPLPFDIPPATKEGRFRPRMKTSVSLGKAVAKRVLGRKSDEREPSFAPELV